MSASSTQRDKEERQAVDSQGKREEKCVMDFTGAF